MMNVSGADPATVRAAMPLPGMAASATSADAAINDVITAAPVSGDEVAGPVSKSSGSDGLWRAGTIVYTSSGIAVLFFWLLWGDFALSMRDRSVGPTVQLFLKSLNASNFTLSMLLTFLPQVIGLIVSPIVSYRSDRLRSRWGRRIPFLLIPTPIGALAMIAIAFSPAIGRVLHGWMGGGLSAESATFVVFGIAWTIFEVALIISGSVFGGLINDVVPRARLGRFYGLFRSISLLDGIIFNMFLFKFAETHFELMFTLIALIFGGGFTLMCLNVREGKYPPPSAVPENSRAGGFIAAARVYVRECFTEPYYRWCFAALTLGTLAFLPLNMFSIFYAMQLNMSIEWYGQLSAYGYIVSICSAYAIGWLVDRFQPLRVGMAMMAAYALSLLYGIIIVHDAPTFGVALFAQTVISGAFFTATASLAQSLLPRGKFAQFASAGMIVTSLTSMLVGPLLGFTLDRTGNNYRLTFVSGFVLAALALVAMAIVHGQHVRRRGASGDVAADD
jgi:MFS family permease